MKKTLLLFAMLLGVVGAWAQTPTDGVYTIENVYNRRGTMCYGSKDNSEYFGLTAITLPTYEGKSVALSDNKYKYWYVTTKSGVTYIYNIGKGVFLQNYSSSNVATCSSTANQQTFTFEDKTESEVSYKCVKSGSQYLSFSCGWNPSDGQVRWLGYEAAASLLTFEKVENGLQTYSKEIAKANAKILGFNLSDAPEDDEWAANTTWYAITLNQTSSILTSTYTDNNNDLLLQEQTTTAPDNDASWCIIGDTENGYKFYNKAYGTTKVLGITGTEDKARATMVSDDTEGYTTSFDIIRSNVTGGTYFCIKEHGSDNNYWNKRGNYLALWKSNQALTGSGSAFLFEDIEEIDFEFTDNTGTIHSGTGKCVKNSNGEFNTRFTIAGIPSAWLTNVTTTDNVYKATIDLPFRLSSESKSNKFMMGGHGVTNFKIYADNTKTKVKVQKSKTPTTSDINQFLWEIYPTFEDGIIKFNIKNVHAEAYIYSETPKTEHADGTLSLDQENKSSFILKKIGNDATFAIDGVNLSINSSGTSDQFVGLNYYTHAGSNMTFIPYWIQYTLTDAANNVYTGEYEGWAEWQPELPTFTGVEYTLTNEAWNGNQFTADIEFNNLPFPISSETKINPTMISSFSGDIYKWYATEAGTLENGVAKKVSVIGTKKNQEPTDANRMTYMWAIYPTLKNNAFTYKVKNLATGTYVHSTSSTNSHAPGAVTLQSEGSELTYVIDSNKKQFKLSTNKYLSLNSTSVDYVQYVGTWDSHGGCGLNFSALEEDVNFDLQAFAVKSEIEGYENTNPNTHLGSITIINGTYGNPLKMTISSLNVEKKNLYLDSNKETSITFTRAYRGFEFKGFKIGEQVLGESFILTEELKNSISEETPLVAMFTTTNDVTLFYDDDAFSYRIPAIAKTSTGRLIAVSDYRHNLDDIGRDNHGTGTKRIDLVARTSDDNGKTWSPIKTIAEGTHDCAYGDAAIAVIGEEVIVMAAGGSVMFNTGSNGKTNKLYRIYSPDNGDTWKTEDAPNITDVTANVYGSENSLFPDVYTSFFGSGKLAVDPNFNNTNKARIYGAMLTQGKGNRVIFSDDKGLTWKELGTAGQNAPASQNEPKVEILPNGQILLSVRRGGGRTFNVFTYGETADDKTNGSGSWATAVNGCNNGGNSCNGEIYRLEVKKTNGDPATLLLQSQPKGDDRQDVTIWYKEISNSNYTPSTIAADWTEGLQVSTQKSAYSAMAEQADGKIAFFFEEAPCYGDDHTKGYSMVYVPLTLEKITGGKYTDKNAQAKTVTVTVTDTLDNTYNESLNIFVSDVETIKNLVKSTWAFADFGDDPIVVTDGTSITYTNTVTLPFKVSNDENTYWHNIYWPANTNDHGYPVYLSASATDDEFVPKVTESQHYGASSYNTKDNASRINWAIYSVNNGLTFKFKNELTGKFIQATGVANGNSQNVKYVAEADATAFEIVKKTGNYHGDYALKASINNSVGYLCSTSVGYANATHYFSNGHQGAWVKFVEAPDFDWHIEAVKRELRAIGTAVGLYATDEDVEAARTAMNSANTVNWNTLKGYYANIRRDGREVNTPSVGMYRIKNKNTGAYIHGNANGTISLASKFDNYTSIFYLNENNQLISYRMGRHLDGQAKNLAEVNTACDVEFNVAYSGVTEGVLTIKSNGAWIGYLLYQPTIESSTEGTQSAAYDWTFEKVEWLPVPVNTSVGYATLYSPVALNTFAPKTQNHRVEAYVGTIKGNRFSMEQVDAEDGIIPAKTPVILVYKQDAENGLVYLQVVDSDKEAPENELSGTFESSYIEDEAYVLSKPADSEIGLYKADKNFYENNGTWTKDTDNGTHFLNNGFKAYLPVTNGSDARFFVFDFGGNETGIESVEGENGNANSEVYDLSGRRVQNAKKGIFIVNGKKVIK